MINTWLTTLVAVLFIFSLYRMFFNSARKSQIITYLNNKAILLDVRTAEEFLDGNVRGSVNVELSQLDKQMHRFKNKDIIVFCRSGNRASLAKKRLIAAGFKNVTNGGSWQNVAQIQSQIQ